MADSHEYTAICHLLQFFYIYTTEIPKRGTLNDVEYIPLTDILYVVDTTRKRTAIDLTC